jgi:hypothetical protein
MPTNGFLLRNRVHNNLATPLALSPHKKFEKMEQKPQEGFDFSVLKGLKVLSIENKEIEFCELFEKRKCIVIFGRNLL